jgi:ribonuclease E
MTRKRIGEGLLEAFADTCPTCNGRGIVVDHRLIDSAGD